MSGREYNRTCIILAAYPLGEADLRLLTFSKEAGRGVAVARGARKAASHLRGLALPYTCIEGSFAVARSGMDVLRQGQLKHGFAPIRDDYDLLAYAAYFAELIIACLPEGRAADGDVFGVLYWALAALAAGTQPDIAARVLELTLMDELGVMPDLKACAACGRPYDGGIWSFAPSRGPLCPACAKTKVFDGLRQICPGAMLSAQKLAAGPAATKQGILLKGQVRDDLAACLGDYLQYQLGRSLKSRTFLPQH